MMNAPTSRPRRVVFGTFKGFGDLLSAAPTIIAELDAGVEVTLLIFPQLRTFTTLLDFGKASSRLRVLTLPLTLRDLPRFLREAHHFAPELIWISPHAVQRDASSKIPLLMWMLSKWTWRGASLAGAQSEPRAYLFDRRASVSRTLPLRQREWTGYAAVTGRSEPAPPASVTFIQRITEQRSQPAEQDVLFHPGASWPNKQWPLELCVELVRRLSVDLRVLILGLPAEIAPLQQALSGLEQVAFSSPPIADALIAIARSRVALTMDSGASHFAATLAVPTVTLFGPTHPQQILPPASSVTPLYQGGLACQPCWGPACIYPTPRCMRPLTPAIVEQRLRALLANTVR